MTQLSSGLRSDTYLETVTRAYTATGPTPASGSTLCVAPFNSPEGNDTLTQNQTRTPGLRPDGTFFWFLNVAVSSLRFPAWNPPS